MDNIIKIKPDKDGKLFIRLYGTRYQIVIEKEEPKEQPKSKSTKK